jgi:16S rRNA processing protein RimM
MAMSPEDFVPLAEVVAAVGLSGEVKLYPLIDWYAPVLESPYLVWMTGDPVTVSGMRPARGCAVVRVTGCGDREGAAALVGRQLGFRRDSYLAADFPKPPGGLPFRWVGRELRLGSGESLGVVGEVRLYGSQLTLVVPGAAGETLVPAVPPILRDHADLEGPLVIDPPEGLLDVAGD